MPKNIVIAEGTQGKTFTGVNKLKTALQGGGSCNWIPEDEAGEYVSLGKKTIRQNGTYRAADDNKTGYSSVNVNVKPNTKSYTFKANGEYNAEDYGLDGFSKANVNVNGTGDIRLKSIRVTSNGNYIAENDNVDGYSAVRVAVKNVTSEAGTFRILIKGIDIYEAGEIRGG